MYCDSTRTLSPLEYRIIVGARGGREPVSGAAMLCRSGHVPPNIDMVAVSFYHRTLSIVSAGHFGVARIDSGGWFAYVASSARKPGTGEVIPAVCAVTSQRHSLRRRNVDPAIYSGRHNYHIFRNI